VAAPAAAARRGEVGASQREGGEAAARTQGRHVVREKAARRWRVHGTWPARATGAAQRRNRGAGAGGGRRGPVCNFSKL
jgi:hypothetical protein